MSNTDPFEIFCVVQPGLEPTLLAEAKGAGFAQAQAVTGGVQFMGQWPDVWRANLCLRGATRVLARLGSFRAMHLAQLDKRARKFDWGAVLKQGVALRVDVTCRKSRIYHAGAATQRIETALRESHGLTVVKEASEAELTLKVRIEDDLCVFSIDTSGESLHKRGHKEAVNKAPMRETLAALFLRDCGYDGSEPVVDPMCGSGTFVIEAAEIAAGLKPGRSRSFAFEKLASFDPTRWAAMKAASTPRPVTLRFYGSDRDAGAVRMSKANAERAQIADLCSFHCHAVGDLKRPEGQAGLVIVNPPYGLRISEKKLLFAVYGTLGKVLKAEFSGWRVAMIAPDAGLAKATGLPFLPDSLSVSHGGTKVTLWKTAPLR
ncbi:Ribosomal RNA large subunit methyltransferase L [Aquimixticola soesokkakensis]|uniref:Ribosomal RNA large subunit methyltransferase L n=1 Tax=Aquimixticola soesokkakensis TaxID=1519096 RepID=A0A1Y5SHN8_9RHOB|nr:RNA methyltransferase [Aquimixticola soesokkakensis]SLN40360.1 Ribosomal RNA large subunit methyltransferase L [Aquimixticola soesokkakensis]